MLKSSTARPRPPSAKYLQSVALLEFFKKKRGQSALALLNIGESHSRAEAKDESRKRKASAASHADSMVVQNGGEISSATTTNPKEKAEKVNKAQSAAKRKAGRPPKNHESSNADTDSVKRRKQTPKAKSGVIILEDSDEDVEHGKSRAPSTSTAASKTAPREWRKCAECDYRHWSDTPCPDFDEAPAAPQHVTEKRWSGTNTRSLFTDLKRSVQEASVDESCPPVQNESVLYDDIDNEDGGVEDSDEERDEMRPAEESNDSVSRRHYSSASYDHRHIGPCFMLSGRPVACLLMI
jgi:hypothetical protein